MVKNPPSVWETPVWSLVGKIPWRREWLPTPAFLPGEFHRSRSLAGCSPRSLRKLNTTERQIFACSCLWAGLFFFYCWLGAVSSQRWSSGGRIRFLQLSSFNTVHLPTYLLMIFWVVSSLGLLQINLLSTFVYNICINFYFSWIIPRSEFARAAYMYV